MLNYVALWLGVWLFGLGGPLQSDTQRSIPVSNDVVGGRQAAVFWGDPELQGLHIGLFIALAALVVFWVLLERSVQGYEARAVGFNPDAAEYGGISAGRTYVKVMLALRPVRRASPARWTCSAGSSGSPPTTSRRRSSASSASRSRCSAATRRSGLLLRRRCCSARC